VLDIIDGAARSSPKLLRSTDRLLLTKTALNVRASATRRSSLADWRGGVVALPHGNQGVMHGGHDVAQRAADARSTGASMSMEQDLGAVRKRQRQRARGASSRRNRGVARFPVWQRAILSIAPTSNERAKMRDNIVVHGHCNLRNLLLVQAPPGRMATEPYAAAAETGIDGCSCNVVAPRELLSIRSSNLSPVALLKPATASHIRRISGAKLAGRESVPSCGCT
jgi:hypothetical protein